MDVQEFVLVELITIVPLTQKVNIILNKLLISPNGAWFKHLNKISIHILKDTQANWEHFYA